jgi:phage gp37-like protein
MNVATVEDHLLAQMQATLGTKVRGYGSLPGQWDDSTIKRVLLSVPGVFVSWGGLDVPTSRNAGAAAIAESTFYVYIATRHASGEAARRRGDALEVGAYELLRVLLPLLSGMTVPGEGTLQLRRAENLFRGEIETKGLALYGITLVMSVGVPATVDEALLDPFTTFAVQYDVPPLTPGEHGKWLGGNYSTSLPDARDTVAVPQ